MKYIKAERSELFEPNVLISFVFEMTGSFSEAEFYHAVQKAWEANETCYSKVVINSDGSAGYMPVSECHNIVRTERMDASIPDIIRREERKEFRIFEGEMMRISFLPGEDQSNRMLIMAHHLAGDGKSILFFAQDIMRSLSGQQLKYKSMVEVDFSKLPPESRLKPRVRWYCNYVNRKWKKEVCYFNEKDYDRLYRHYWELRETELLVEHFSMDEVNRLLELTREHGITLSTLISVIMLKNSKAYGRNIRTGFAVDTRVKEDESMSNQVAGISVDMPYNYKKDIWWNAAAFQKCMTECLQSPKHRYFIYRVIPAFHPSLFDSVFFSRFGLHDSKLCRSFSRIMGYAENSERTLGITNINRLPINDQYGGHKIKSCVFIPPAVTYSKRTVGIITDPERMNITFHGIRVNGVHPDTGFFTGAMKELHELTIE